MTERENEPIPETSDDTEIPASPPETTDDDGTPVENPSG